MAGKNGTATEAQKAEIVPPSGETALAPAAQTAVVAPQVPSGLSAGGMTPGQEVEREDFVFPRLRLLQALSGEVTEGEFSAGQMLNSLTKEPLTAPWKKGVDEDAVSIVIIPFLYAKQRVLFEDKTMLCRSDDGRTGQGDPGGICAKCPLSQWDGRTPPKCTQQYTYLSLVCDENGDITDPMPIAVQFAKTSAVQGRKLNTMWEMSGKALWAGRYRVTVKQQSNKKGTFYVFDLRRQGDTPLEQQNMAAAAYTRFAGSAVRVDMDPSDFAEPEETSGSQQGKGGAGAF